MKNIINIILINTKKLKKRVAYINSTLTYLKNIIEKNKYQCNIIIIDTPDVIEIKENKKKYDERRKEIDNIKYKEQSKNINNNQISNIEKHINALDKVKKDEYNMIIEDDLIISKDYIENIEKIFTKILKENNFDILITSDFINNNNDELEISDYKNYNNILLSKSSYFINYNTAIDLKNYLYNLEYNMKVLLSKYLDDNVDKKEIKILNKCTFLEGSKVGIFLSSTKSKNFLSQNTNYIELTKILKKNDLTDEDYEIGKKIYDSLEYLNNGDIIYAYAIMEFKKGNIKSAKQKMEDAIMNIYNNEGYYSSTDDILNNAINICQYDQDILDKCKNNKSKYLV
jgi:hypothetical protein|tara:strand:- start:1550 stop:2575 length:1026 start_codon:yes stop_codon:yes gene_type:complete